MNDSILKPLWFKSVFLSKRLQIPRNHLACVGTSATLGGKEGKAEMLNYASELFDESFAEEAVIEEDRLTSSEFLADAFIDPTPVPSSDRANDLNPSKYETIENQFIAAQQRHYPNLLSATSTLEMGINIGDLSSALLCSVPPTQANYQQRVGRTGGTDGNSFVVAIANGRPR